MLLELSDVSKRYVTAGGDEETSVLKGVSLSVAAGESVAIVGPSGSGKSTLLNIIGTLDRPTEGRVLLEGTDLASLGDGEVAKVRNAQIGFIFQAHHLLPQLTVVENVLTPVLAFGSVDDGAVKRARDLLDRVGLSHRLGHRPGQLSGGERQRVAVVRALINEPKLLLADEPTGALDQHTAEQMGTLLVELNREQQVTMLVVTHSRELAERMQRGYELRDGELVGGSGAKAGATAGGVG